MELTAEVILLLPVSVVTSPSEVLGSSYTINNIVIPLSCCKHSTRTSTSEPGACAKTPGSEFMSYEKVVCTLYIYMKIVPTVVARLTIHPY